MPKWECKICSLDIGLRMKIEDDLRNNIKTSIILKKYPQAELNYSNIYSHRQHLQKDEALRSYEATIRDRHAQGEKMITVGNQAQTDQSLSLIEVPQSNLPTIQSSGNPLTDDLNALDLIITQGSQILDKVLPKDVIAAISLKQKLLGNIQPDSSEESKISIAAILQVISER